MFTTFVDQIFKRMKLFFYSLFVVFIGLSGCTSKSNASRKPVTNIQITPSNKIVTYGNDLSVSISSKLNSSELANLELYIDNELIEKYTTNNITLKIDSKKYLPGNHTIKTIATNKKGVVGINYNTFSILSEIQPINMSYEIIETIPHNSKNFTQGLEFYEGKLFESTGDYGTSFIYAYQLKDLKLLKSLKIDDTYFGEGITILNKKIYQLTYKHKIGFIYDVDNFEKIGEFSFSSQEGWGLTNDGKNLIMSDGSSTLNFIDPINFSIVKSIQVTHTKGFVSNLNELEYVEGSIYANIWTTDQIVKIEAKTGKVQAFIDLSTLKNSIKKRDIDVLNGIAYNKSNDSFYITGKLWPSIYKVKFLVK